MKFLRDREWERAYKAPSYCKNKLHCNDNITEKPKRMLYTHRIVLSSNHRLTMCSLASLRTLLLHVYDKKIILKFSIRPTICEKNYLTFYKHECLPYWRQSIPIPVHLYC